MRIEEGEGGVLGERDALAGRRQRVAKPPAAGASGAASARMASRSSDRSTMSASRSRCAIEVGMLAGLHQAEMALRQAERRVAQDGADHRQAERLDRVAATAARGARCPAGSARRRRCARPDRRWQSPWRRPRRSATGRRRRAPAAPAGRRAGRDRRPSRCGPAPRECRRTGPWRFRRPRSRHRRLRRAASASSSAGGIAQLSRLTPGRAGGGGVEARVDVVGPGLGAAHRQAAPAQRAQEADGDAGLARAGARRADDEGAGGHALRPRERQQLAMATMPPTTISAGEAEPGRRRLAPRWCRGRRRHALVRRRGGDDHRRRCRGAEAALASARLRSVADCAKPI